MTSLYDPTDHRPMHDSKTAFVDRTTELVDRVVSPEDYMDKDAGYEATQDGAYNAIIVGATGATAGGSAALCWLIGKVSNSSNSYKRNMGIPGDGTRGTEGGP